MFCPGDGRHLEGEPLGGQDVEEEIQGDLFCGICPGGTLAQSMLNIIFSQCEQGRSCDLNLEKTHTGPLSSLRFSPSKLPNTIRNKQTSCRQVKIPFSDDCGHGEEVVFEPWTTTLSTKHPLATFCQQVGEKTFEQEEEKREKERGFVWCLQLRKENCQLRDICNNW